jgi:hypothetical protein
VRMGTEVLEELKRLFGRYVMMRSECQFRGNESIERRIRSLPFADSRTNLSNQSSSTTSVTQPKPPANVRVCNQLPHQMCSKILTHIPLSLASNYVLFVVLFPQKDIGDKKSMTSHYTYQEKRLNNCLQS